MSKVQFQTSNPLTDLRIEMRHQKISKELTAKRLSFSLIFFRKFLNVDFDRFVLFLFRNSPMKIGVNKKFEKDFALINRKVRSEAQRKSQRTLRSSLRLIAISAVKKEIYPISLVLKYFELVVEIKSMASLTSSSLHPIDSKRCAPCFRGKKIFGLAGTM
jgi:hypothetical protein